MRSHLKPGTLAPLFILFMSICSLLSASAQSDGVDINILAVDDSGYPQIDVYLSVIDRQRLAVISSLDKTNFFGDTDNGQAMEVVEASRERRPLNVVVVMDVTGSVSQSELDNQRLAIAELTKGMTPADLLGVVVMDESRVRVAASLQNDYEAVLASLNTIQIREDATGNVYWDGVYEAASLLQTSAENTRRVVIIMTDVSPSGGEGTHAEDEILTLALENEIEIFGLYFEYEGDGIPEDPPVLPPELTLLSEATGGFTQGVPAETRRDDYTDDQALAPMMGNALGVLQSQYRVRFTVPIAADGTAHNFTVRVDVDGILTPPITGTFKAGEAAILITFPGITPEQNITLPTTMNFRVEPKQGAIQSVKVTAITGAGQEIELPTRGQYEVTLERGQFSPGLVTLVVSAQDSAGSQQESVLPLNIIDQLAVDWASQPPDTVKADETVRLSANIGFAASVQQVEFLVNGEVVEMRDLGPFDAVEFQWTPSSKGDYSLEIVAQDIQGQRASAQAKITVQAAVSQTEKSGGLSGAFLAVLGLAFLGGVGLSAAGIWMLRRRPSPQFHPEIPMKTPQPTIADVPPPLPRKTVPASAEIEGPNGEHWRLVEGQNTLGRHSSNHIQIMDESVSRHHAVIEVISNHFYYMDLPSASHPSEMNGSLLQPEQRYELHHGQVIRIGSSLVRFVELDQSDGSKNYH